MKKTFFLKSCMLLVVSMSALFVWTSCQKEPNDTPMTGGEGESTVFNFSTKSIYTLDVQYDVPKGYNVYFEVYAENPLQVNEDGTTERRNDEPIDKGYTDDNGRYNNRIVLPAYVQTVYVYSPNVGVPQLLKASVVNGVLSPATIPFHADGEVTMAQTRADNWCTTVVYPDITTKTLGKWEHWSGGSKPYPNISSSVLIYKTGQPWGRPDYLYYKDQTVETGGEMARPISAELLKTINATLSGVDAVQDEYDVLSGADVHIVSETTLDICLIDDRGAYMNTLAYYCYPTDTPPASGADIKVQVIALPDAKILQTRHNPIPGSGYGVFDYGALRPGEGVRLHYIDQQGVDHGETFPAGVSVGWILYADGYADGYGDPIIGLWPGTLSKGYGPIYSNPALQQGVQYVALFRRGSEVVLSFEDSAKNSVADKRDYDDVIFSVVASVPEAITPTIPDKAPDAPAADQVVAEVIYRGILLFEDIWPYRGDFDMNDVVVKYVSRVGYNVRNEVVQTVEEYTPLWSGAQFNNSFAYSNLNLTQGATVTFEGGDGSSVQDADNKTIIRLASHVLDYATQDTKKTFKVTTKYTTPIAKNDFVLPPYNPFINVNSALDHEVHLTNMAPTSYADITLLGTGHDKSDAEKGYYYITYDEQGQQMPFAIDVMFLNDEAMGDFVIPKEMKCINLYYPGFMSWIGSKGQTNKDWYLHPIE